MSPGAGMPQPVGGPPGTPLGGAIVSDRNTDSRSLEGAIDAFERVANIIEQIAVKES